MNKIGDTITVSKEEAKALRKQGWMHRGDIVTMMFVGRPPKSVKSNMTIASEIACEKTRGKSWLKSDHEFVARKLAEARA